MDIREILAALTDEDKTLWQHHRTEMRRSYMTAHNSALGLTAWDIHDDAFLDLIDIKLALVFDRAGRFESTKKIIGDGAIKIESDILTKETELKITQSKAVKGLPSTWQSKLDING